MIARSRGLDIRQKVEDAHLPAKVHKVASQCVSAQASFHTSVKSMVHDRISQLREEMAKVDITKSAVLVKQRVVGQLGDLDKQVKSRFNYSDFIRQAQVNVPLFRAKSVSAWLNTCNRTSKWTKEARHRFESVSSRTQDGLQSFKDELQLMWGRSRGTTGSFSDKLKGWWTLKIPKSLNRSVFWTFWSSPVKKTEEEQSAWAKLLDHKWKLGWSK